MKESIKRLRALEKQFYEDKSHSIWFYLQALSLIHI